MIGLEGGLTAAHSSAELVELTRLICLFHAGYSYFTYGWGRVGSKGRV